MHQGQEHLLLFPHQPPGVCRLASPVPQVTPAPGKEGRWQAQLWGFPRGVEAVTRSLFVSSWASPRPHSSLLFLSFLPRPTPPFLGCLSPFRVRGSWFLFPRSSPGISFPHLDTPFSSPPSWLSFLLFPSFQLPTFIIHSPPHPPGWRVSGFCLSFLLSSFQLTWIQSPHLQFPCWPPPISQTSGPQPLASFHLRLPLPRPSTPQSRHLFYPFLDPFQAPSTGTPALSSAPPLPHNLSSVYSPHRPG